MSMRIYPEGQLKEQYDQLINDKRFDELELGLNKPNLFEILRIPRNEIRHSNFLSWLLDPKGSHGLGDIFLTRFVRKIFYSDKVMEVDQIEVSNLDFSNAEVKREWQKIDVLIAFDDVVVCVENKVGSREHSNQLSRYKTIVEQEYPNRRHAFVYLTPEGDESEEESEIYVELSWGEIVDILDRIVSVYSESIVGAVRTYMQDYISILKRYVIGQDDLTDLAKEIYLRHQALLVPVLEKRDNDVISRIWENHKAIFEFIEENKPDIKGPMRDAFVEILRDEGLIVQALSKNYIDFTTQNLDELTYYNRVRDGRPAFYFSLHFTPDKGSNTRLKPWTQIRICPSIGPVDPQYDRQKLIDLVAMSVGDKATFKQRPNSTVTPARTKVYDLGLKDFYDNQEIGQYIEESMSEFREIVKQLLPDIKKVEEAFVECREELLELKRRAEKAY